MFFDEQMLGTKPTYWSKKLKERACRAVELTGIRPLRSDSFWSPGTHHWALSIWGIEVSQVPGLGDALGGFWKKRNLKRKLFSIILSANFETNSSLETFLPFRQHPVLRWWPYFDAFFADPIDWIDWPSIFYNFVPNSFFGLKYFFVVGLLLSFAVASE